MTSYQLITLSENVLSELQDDKYLVATVTKLASYYDAAVPLYAEAVNTEHTQHIVEWNNKARSVINEFIAFYKSQRFGKLFTAIDKLKEELGKNSLGYSLKEDNSWKMLQEKLEKYFEIVDNFNHDQSFKSAYTLIVVSKELLTVIQVHKEYLNTIIESLQTKLEIGSEEEKLTLLFGSEVDYNEFYSKLSNLGIIYNRLCILYGVSIKDFPLKIVKIESGSELIVVVGYIKAIVEIINIAKIVVNYFQAQWTKKHVIIPFSEKVTIAKDLLQLEKNLKENEYDTSAMREDISAASQILAKEFCHMVAKEGNISIDGEIFSVGLKEQQQLYLEENRIKLLEEGNNETK